MASSGSDPGDLRGREIGPYRIVRRLGVGGMAETYEAIRQGPSGFTQRVCLKLVLPFLRNDREFIRLFEREARLAAQLRHRNIVGIIDFGQFDGRSYMALELIEGADMRMILEHQPRRRLSVDSAVLVGLELADALQHAHGSVPSAARTDDTQRAGIVHRDISPSNVLVSRQGEVMLTDFGVAKAMSGASRQQSSVKGKVPYMSPEQLRAEPLDGRADLFALGVVLYEAISGRRPYDGPHDPATIMLILNGDRSTLGEVVPEAPPGLCEVVDSLLEPDRENRPESASVVMELLDPFASSTLHRRALGEIAVESRIAAERSASEISAVVEHGATEPGLGPMVEDTGVKPAGSSAGAVGAEAPAPPSSELVVEPEERAPAPVPSPAPAPPTSRKPRRASLIAALVLLGAVVLGVFAWVFGDGADSDLVREQRIAENRVVEDPPPSPEVRAPDPTAASNTEPVVDESAGEAPAAKPVAESAVAPDVPTPSKRAAETAPVVKPPRKAVRPEPSRLTVIVFPWGDVWIDGKRVGSAPIRNRSLKPGRYTVGAGESGPSKTQTVRLAPGERKTVRFDMTP